MSGLREDALQALARGRADEAITLALIRIGDRLDMMAGLLGVNAAAVMGRSSETIDELTDRMRGMAGHRDQSNPSSSASTTTGGSSSSTTPTSRGFSASHFV